MNTQYEMLEIWNIMYQITLKEKKKKRKGKEETEQILFLLLRNHF